jgi:hypothetical protein
LLNRSISYGIAKAEILMQMSVSSPHIAVINESARRTTGADSDFFRACSLRKSKSDCAELRFIRSVLFYYSLLCECGAKPVRFCINQTHFQSLVTFDVGSAIKTIHALRTQAAHSLDQTASDEQLQFTARSWFRQHTANDFPENENHWGTCANRIEETGTAVVDAIKRFIEILELDKEMDAMKRELRQAIEGAVRRVDVESIVADVLNELGRNDLSPGKLCDKFFADWSRTLLLKSGKANQTLDARKLIETSVSQIAEPPPITAKEMMAALQVPRGPLVGELVIERDRLFKAGLRDRSELLKSLSRYLKAKETNG